MDKSTIEDDVLVVVITQMELEGDLQKRKRQFGIIFHCNDVTETIKLPVP